MHLVQRFAIRKDGSSFLLVGYPLITFLTLDLRYPQIATEKPLLMMQG